jgi:hypothetical membrane protein
MNKHKLSVLLYVLTGVGALIAAAIRIASEQENFLRYIAAGLFFLMLAFVQRRRRVAEGS